MNPTPTPTTTPWRKAGDYLLIAAFLALITAPCGLMRIKEAELIVHHTEYRIAAGFPQLEFRGKSWFKRPRTASLSAFPKGFEAWLNDRVRFRQRFIQLHSLAKISGLISEGGFQHKRGEIPGEKVLVGEKGWLYFSGEHMAEEFTARTPFKSAELEEWAASIAARAAWLDQQGIRYVLFFAPNPQTIYPDYVPKSVGPQGKPSRLDQLQARLKGVRNLEFIDLRPDLIAGKSVYPTYQKTDTHWTAYGAYIGYRTVMERLKSIFPNAEPEPLSHFAITVKPVPSTGNLARMLNSPLPVNDIEVKLKPTIPRKARLVANKSAYGRIIESPDAPLPRAVLIHDSFYPYMTQLFDEHWQHLCSVWTLEFPADVIEQERPNVVFQEMVERKLMIDLVPNPPQVDAVRPNRLATRDSVNGTVQR